MYYSGKQFVFKRAKITPGVLINPACLGVSPPTSRHSLSVALTIPSSSCLVRESLKCPAGGIPLFDRDRLALFIPLCPPIPLFSFSLFFIHLLCGSLILSATMKLGWLEFVAATASVAQAKVCHRPNTQWCFLTSLTKSRTSRSLPPTIPRHGSTVNPPTGPTHTNAPLRSSPT